MLLARTFCSAVCQDILDSMYEFSTAACRGLHAAGRAALPKIQPGAYAFSTIGQGQALARAAVARQPAAMETKVSFRQACMTERSVGTTLAC